MRHLLACLPLLLVLCAPRSPSAGDDSSGLSPLLSAVLYGDLEKARSLAEAGADPGASGDALDSKPLLVAAWNGDAAMVEMLLGKGAIVDGVDIRWQTALMKAARTGALDVVKILLKAGASTDMKDRNRDTPVCHAAASRNSEVLAYLHSRGVHLDACTLASAARAERTKNLKLLLKKGDFEVGDVEVAFWATENKTLKKLLKKHQKKLEKLEKKATKEEGILAALGSTNMDIEDFTLLTCTDCGEVGGVLSAVGSDHETSPAQKIRDHWWKVQSRVHEKRSSLSGCLFKKKKSKNPWANLAMSLNANGKLLQVRVTAGKGLPDDFESCAADVLTKTSYGAPPSGAIVIPVSVDL